MGGKHRNQWALLLALTLLLGGANIAMGEENVTAYEAYLAGGEAPSLASRYERLFTIGVATSPEVLKDERAAALIAANFNSLTCENQMKADAVLDRSASIRAGDNTRAKLNLSKAGPVLAFAQEHGREFRYLEDWEFPDLTDCDCLHLWRYPGDAEPFTTLGGPGEDAWWEWP
ncbi:MAG: endo-1,4-beta-xylanase [Clostridia bacterium]|nr:endo-1,4-beta-xylanase [Clostridia bacterium]